MFLFLLLFLYIPIYATEPYIPSIFVDKTLVLTSFSDIVPNQKTYAKSEDITLHFSFETNIAIGAEIRVFGTFYPKTHKLYIDDPSHIYVLKENPILSKFSKFRIYLSKKIIAFSSRETAALVLSLVLGNKSYLNYGFIKKIQLAGLSHLFALSGLHLLIFSGFIIFLLKILQISDKMILFISMLFSIFYLFLGGFGISLQRAVLFHILTFVFLIFRHSSHISGIYFIALISSLILFPHRISNLSFLLSYAAVGGIIYIQSFCFDWCIAKFGKYIGSLLSISIATAITTLPIIIVYIGYFHLLFWLLSIIVIPFMPLVLILCFLHIIIPIFDIPIRAFYYIVDMLSTGITSLSFLIIRIPNTFFFCAMLFSVVFMYYYYVRKKLRSIS